MRRRFNVLWTIMVCLFLGTNVYAQCPDDNNFYVDLTPAGLGLTATNTCVWTGEYATASVISGENYLFSTCATTGVDVNMTLYNAAGSVFIATDDDGCGTAGGASVINWTATFTGTVNIVIDEFLCTASSLCVQVDVTHLPPCLADAGTVSVDMPNTGANNYVLCIGDVINMNSNQDYVLPTAADIAGLGFAIYNCSPTTGNPDTDPCFTGYYWSGDTLTEANVVGGTFYDFVLNNPVPGFATATGNTLCFVPITMDDIAFIADGGADDNFGHDIDGDFCFAEGAPICVTYLDSIRGVGSQNCATGAASISITGGYPGFFNPLGTYTVTNTGPGTMVQSGAQGEVLTFTGHTPGQTLTVNVTDDGNGCSQTITYITPVCAACAADAGTVSVDMPNTGANNYVLCIGDVINMNSNQDYVLPPAADIAGLGFAIYNCSPTTGDPDTDPCFTGYYWTGDTLSETNTVGGTLYDFIINNPAGPGFAIPSGNTLCFVPITMDDIASIAAGGIDNNLGHDIDGDGCFVEGAPICVTYLDSIRGAGTQSCTTPSAVITLTGGYAGFFNPVGTYTVTNTGPGTMVQSGAQGEILTFTGYTTGQTLTVNVTNDGNGCSQTITYTTPVCVVCLADAGTQTILVNGLPATSPLVLCQDDCFDILTDSNFVLPTPVVGETPELMYAIYTGVPNLAIEPDLDPNFSGFFWTGGDFSDCNNSASPIIAAGIGNAFHFVPITMDDGDDGANPNGIFHYDNNGDSCYALGTPVEVVFLDEITATITDNCQSVVFVLDGGYPAFNPGSGAYTVINSGAGTMTQTGVTGDTITFTGHTPGQVVSFNVSNDGNSCLNSFSHTSNIPPVVTLDNIVNSSCSANDGAVNLTTTLTPCNFDIDMFDTYGDGWNGAQLNVTVGGVPAVGSPFTIATGFIGTVSFTALPGQAVVFTYVSGAWDGEVSYDVYHDGNLVFSDGTNPTIGLAFSTSCPPYTYDWSNSATTEDIMNLASGPYTLTVTDNSGCTSISGPHTVLQANAPVVTLSSIDSASCNGNNDGAVNLSVSGGTPTITYLWSDGQVTQDATGLIAGSYSVTVSDASGCSVTSGPHTVLEPTVLAVVIDSVTNGRCAGDLGAIYTTASGGTAGYTYNWSNAAVTDDIIGLTANTYTITVSDFNGCTATNSAAVTVAPLLAGTATVDSNVTCFGAANGGVSIVASGGTPYTVNQPNGTGYTYLWTNGSVNTTSIGLSAGAHCVTITDSLGCIEVVCVNVTEPTAVAASLVSSSNLNCNGDASGSITVSGAGGTVLGAYTYLWNVAASSQVTATATGLSANIGYTVTVTDDNGCSDVISNVSLTEPSAITVTIDNTVGTACGDSSGVVMQTSLGGTGTLTYLWSNGAVTEDISGLLASSYTVTVTDASGCTATNSAIVNNTAAGTISFTTTDATCNGASDGCIVATVTGNTGGLSYSWSNGAIVDSICGLAAGTYTLTVTDTIVPGALTLDTVYFETFQGVHNWNLSVPTGTNGATPNVWEVNDTESGVAPPGCGTGGTGDQTLHITCTNALCGLFFTGALYDATQESNIQTESPVFSTVGHSNITMTFDYIANGDGLLDNASLWYNDGTGWTELDSTLKSPLCGAQGQWTAYTVALPASCNNNPTVQLGFNWTNNADNIGTDPSIAVNNILLTSMTAGAGAQVCTIINDTTITEPTPVVITVDSTTNPDCIAANGAAYITVAGGTGAYSFNWSNASTDEDATGLAVNTYTVVASDASGCTDTASATLTAPNGITVTVDSSINVACNPTGAAYITATGGTGTLSYIWSNGAITDDIVGLVANTYTVTVSDVNGCSMTASVTITQASSVSVTASVTSNYNGEDVSCFGSTDGEVTAVGTGGSPAYSFVWDNGATTAVVTGLGGGTYNVTVTDAGGCSATDVVSVTEPNTLAMSVDTIAYAVCTGSSNGFINISVSGGTGTIGYSWSNGDTIQDISGLADSSYIVVVTDANGCSTTDTMVVGTLGFIEIVVDSVTNVGCNGDSTGAIYATATGDTSLFGCSFNQVALNEIMYRPVSNNGQNPNTGEYIELIGPPGADLSCYVLSDGDWTITIPPGTTMPADGFFTIGNDIIWGAGTFDLDAENCNCFTEGAGGLGLLILTDGGEYVALYDGVGTFIQGVFYSGSATTIANSPSGQTVNTIGTASCVSSVVIPNVPSFESAPAGVASGTSIIRNPDGSGAWGPQVGGSLGSCNMFGTGSTGNGTVTYLWSNGDTTQDVSGLPAGNYTVTATNSYGCTATTSYTITEPALLTATITNTIDVGCVGDSTGAIDIAVAGGTSPYSYNWSNGATTRDVANLALGTYCVIVTDSNSCVATLCDTISEPFFNIPTDTFYICPQDSVQIQVNTNATVINWTPSATLSNDTIANPFASPTVTTTYVVTASVAGSACVMTDSVVVMIETLDVSLAGQTNVNCNGDNTGSITTSIAAGSYNYNWSNGATTANLSGLGQGTYMLTVSNSGTCIDTLIVNITEPAALTVTLSSSSDVICPGDSTGSIGVAVTGGTTAYTYLWTSGETTATANALWAGFTVVTVTDGNACTATFDMNVVEPVIIQISSTVIPAGCGGANDGSITVSPTGGNGAPYTYLWNAGAGSQTTATATGLGFSTYTVTVTDNAGCVSTANGLLVPQAAALDSADAALIVADTTLACDLVPVSIGINTTNNYTYLWSNGETTQDATGLGVGVYFVTVTNNDGCFVIQTGTISAPEVPFINPWIDNIGQTAATTTPNTLIHIDGNNFQTGVSYLWEDSTAIAVFDDETSDTTSVSAGQSGTYILTLTATSLTSGCQDTGVVVLNVEGEFMGMPNAFTPNGDGTNDLFFPLGLSAHEVIQFRVFNRWGQEIYNGDELENGGWDGKYLGVPQPSEAYLFILEYDLGTKVKILKGEFSLIR